MSESLLNGGNSEPAPGTGEPVAASSDPVVAQAEMGGAPDPAPAAAADPGAPVEVNISYPDDWKMGLDDDIKNDPSLGAINDIPNLAKSYVNAQRMIGADKIQVPNKYDDGSQLKAALHKLGLPNDVAEYDVKPATEGFDETLLNDYKAKAYEAGILPKQAQGMLDWFAERQANEDTTFTEQYQQKMTEQIEGLKKEWGAGFDVRVGLAQQTLDHFTDDSQELKDHIVGQYGQDTNFIKFLAKVGDSLKEGRIIKEGNSDPFAVTPEVAMQKINEMRNDGTHPLNDKNHPQHDHALKEYEKFTEIAYS